ncbi:unnamed protein product [Lupinus luteus]|uniref:Uncharacterized protein n=1 Tax=Lupinus luteus TaxID=3873 RepID=A0AAV1YG27_LUPLU
MGGDFDDQITPEPDSWFQTETLTRKRFESSNNFLVPIGIDLPTQSCAKECVVPKSMEDDFVTSFPYK